MKSLLFFAVLIVSFSHAQTVNKDSSAIYILDRMSSVLGDLQSCSFTVKRSNDVLVNAYGPEKHFGTDKVQMVGPDKMTVQRHGDDGHKGYWYNGGLLARYDYDENNYTIVETPNNIISMIDSINQTYGVRFPAADFFYPTFTDNLIDNFDNIVFLGKRKIDGDECYYILVTNRDMNIQFWINDGAYALPKKFLITYKNEDNLQFEGTFSDWILNPDIPVTVFDFLPPPGAKQLAILPQS